MELFLFWQGGPDTILRVRRPVEELLPPGVLLRLMGRVKLFILDLRHVFKLVLILDETLGSLLNLPALHPRIQMLRVHPMLHDLRWQVVLGLLDRPRIHDPLLHLVTLMLILLSVVLLSQVSKICAWVLIPLLLNGLMLFIQLVDDWVNIHRRRIDNRNHISRRINLVQVVTLSLAEAAAERPASLPQLMVSWFLLLRGVE